MGLDNGHRDSIFMQTRYNSLVWLKEYNVYCHDMHIDMNGVQSLPDDGVLRSF